MTRAELEDCIAALKASAAGIHEAVQRTVDRMEKDLITRGAIQPTRTDAHHAYCGACGCRLPEKIRPRFCHKCGEKVEWKDAVS